MDEIFQLWTRIIGTDFFVFIFGVFFFLNILFILLDIINFKMYNKEKVVK